MTLSKRSPRTRGLFAAVLAIAMAFAGLAAAAPAFASGEDVCENIAGIQTTMTDGYANDGYGLCTTPNAVHVTVTAPTVKQGTCDNVGTVVLPVSTQYTWEASGTSAATIETATPVGDVVFDGPTVYDRAQFGPYDLSKLSGDACPAPPTHVTAAAPTYTPGTCSVVGTVVATNTAQYTWATSGTSVATIETASAVGSVVLDGQKVFGPYNLSKLSGEACPTTPATVYQTDVWLMAPAATATITQGDITYPQNGVTQNKNLSVQTLDVTVPTTCGTKYQVDAYAQLFWNGESTTDNAAALNALFASGLAGPNGAQDGKFLAGAGHNPGVYGLGHAWKIVVNPDCAPPIHVTVVVPTLKQGTCSDLGTVVAPNTTQYTWTPSGTEAATYETATAVGNVVLDGQKVFGPYNLSKLSGSTCPTPPVVCVASSGFSSDEGDLAPTPTAAGLVFLGGHALAVDTYQHVSGNAQGITSLVVTESSTHGYTARPVIEVDPNISLNNNGTVNHYATLSTASEEPNGVTDAIASQLWYTSKIAYSSPGGQGHPLPYSQLIALMPANSLIQIGLHLQTNSHGVGDPAGQDTSTVASLEIPGTNCGSNFTYLENASASVSVGTAQTCSDSSAETSSVAFATLTSVDGKSSAVLDQTVGNHTAVFTVNDGHLAADGTTTITKSYTITGATASQSINAAAPCFVAPKDASASVSLGTTQTCTDSSAETFAVTNATLGTVDGKTVTALVQTAGDHVAVFSAATNHLFTDGTASLTAKYTIVAHTASQSTDASASCYVKPTTATTPPTTNKPPTTNTEVLAYTGATGLLALIGQNLLLFVVGLLLVIVLGVVFIVWSYRRRNGEVV